ncbi:MAG: DUF368 domain-containing protein [Firmicutes bacterium HGW-Firmicutes-7]|nr:MAG: DUF368 domain-containing protein [Firmicutes bacterium HGW-Firmicutes-7]
MKYLRNFLKGMIIGIATLVPGVSGGTMAVILGIYDDLIHAISSFFEDWKKHTLLLLELGLGALLSVVLFSHLLENAIIKFPFTMQFLFMGIIIGGLPVLYRKCTSVGESGLMDYIFLFIGFITILLMAPDPEMSTNIATSQGLLGMLYLFIAGIVIAVAFILPGISGSFMLLTLGLYGMTLNAIQLDNINIPFLIPLVLGVAFGILAATKIIEKLLQKYPRNTYMLIMGFVLGSLIAVYPGIPTKLETTPSIVAFIIGFIAILLMSKSERD